MVLNAGDMRKNGQRDGAKKAEIAAIYLLIGHYFR